MLTRIKDFIKRLAMIKAAKANYKFIMKDWASLRDLDSLSKVLETKRFSQNLQPVVMARPKGRNVLVIAPHPDDDVFSSGGTLLKLVRGGSKVRVIYLTSGSHKTYKDKNGRILSDEASRLEEESKEVSKNLGTDIEYWRYNTKGINVDEESIKRVRDVCVKLQPDLIFVPFIADDHDDHRESVRLFYEAFKDFKGLKSEIWAYQIYSTVLPNVVIDITDEMNEKLRLVNLWKSRLISRDWAHYIRGLNALNSRFLKTNGARYAESFFVVPAKEYIELCKVYFNNETKS